MDGFEATRRIRAREARAGDRRTPIVALTASAMAGDQQRCLEAGMDDYISKPVTSAGLAEALSRWAVR
jgi:CheY-like chemotaxis protein